MRFVELRRRLSRWLYPVNVVELTRYQLDNIGDPTLVEDTLVLNSDDLSAASHIHDAPVFLKVCSHLKRVQLDYIACRAEDMRQVDFARASINGITLVEEEFERLNNLWQEELNKTKPFNPHDIL